MHFPSHRCLYLKHDRKLMRYQRSGKKRETPDSYHLVNLISPPCEMERERWKEVKSVSGRKQWTHE